MNTSARPARSAGFTLIELLVVTAILGLLAVFASHAVVGFASRVVERGASEPTGSSQAARLVQLAGVAVLLFGAGFWYLAELRRPGQLERFRLGQFLLLALTYSLFFVTFAVLDARGWTMTQAVGTAALVSYPLVAMHVATIVGWRFALTAALPLTAWTTGIVVNGACGGDLRSLIYLAMLAGAVAFLTWSQPRLLRGIEAHRASLERQLGHEVERLTTRCADLRTELAGARRLLRNTADDDGHGLHRWLEQRVADGERLLDQSEALCRARDALPGTTPRAARHRACAQSLATAAFLRDRLPQAIAALAATAANLARHRERHATQAAPTAAASHCTGCGHANATDARYCATCGRPAAIRRECPRCAQVLHLPTHLLGERAGDQRLETHCPRCGERHREAS